MTQRLSELLAEGQGLLRQQRAPWVSENSKACSRGGQHGSQDANPLAMATALETVERRPSNQPTTTQVYWKRILFSPGEGGEKDIWDLQRDFLLL